MERLSISPRRVSLSAPALEILSTVCLLRTKRLSLKTVLKRKIITLLISELHSLVVLLHILHSKAGTT